MATQQARRIRAASPRPSVGPEHKAGRSSGAPWRGWGGGGASQEAEGLQCEGCSARGSKGKPHAPFPMDGGAWRATGHGVARARHDGRDSAHKHATLPTALPPKPPRAQEPPRQQKVGPRRETSRPPKHQLHPRSDPRAPPLPPHRLPGKPPRVKALSFLIQMIPRTSYVAHFKSEPYCPQSNQHDLEKTHMSVCHSRRSKLSRQGSPLRQIRQLKTHVLTAAGQHPASAAILRTSLTSPPLLPSLLFPQHWPPCCSLDPHGSGPSLHLEYSLQGG